MSRRARERMAVWQAKERFAMPPPHHYSEDQMTDDDDEHLTMLADCEQRESRLSDWERGFVGSLRSQIEAGRSPTQKQIDALNSIWDRVTG